jgi:exoribonuclease R
VNKGRDLLAFIGVTPTAKNAKKVLLVSGLWGEHENVEKHVLKIRDQFPPKVLREAQHLLDCREAVPDPDKAIRRDLRHLRCYAIDSEGGEL